MPVRQLTNSDRELLKSKSVASLPDNPSNKGFSADQIKKKQYEPQLLLFDWLQEIASSFQEDFTTALKTKLEGIETGAEVNVLEGVKVDGTPLTIGADKKVDVVISGKVDKVSSTSKVYGTDDSGEQTTYSVDDLYDGSIARRHASGQIQVPVTPSENGHASSKQYVDSFAKSLAVSIDSSTFVMTFVLKDKNNNTLATQNIDLPLETMVVSGSYDDENKKMVLTLKNNQTIDIPVADLISGLVNEDRITPLEFSLTQSDLEYVLEGE